MALSFISAIQIEVSASLEFSRLVSIPALPLPINATQHPQYEAARRIAPIWPSVQGGIVVPQSIKTMAITTPQFKAPNLSQSSSRRQSVTRVLIIGDSITRSQEGDYIWRYRIWQWFHSSRVSVKTVGP
ncbi:carbohydrate esterase family 3 protein [Bipolaris sorokiniana ND90Pr]|uniref:Carbohydrate esterase family 3 protein n=1 Tax=Cochliobolus sativus (strain ND90Pr / ATCC 201652) TaxID=665912 RepID=M2SUN0_COCSN|nr:carbohydrate esterase family 3 protein [Bipolaris sorokiniana ND90Pr]EMD66010.1 carbohydrate esterase family 3 protein [Bipolaris sorokiniana ND90Pr]